MRVELPDSSARLEVGEAVSSGKEVVSIDCRELPFAMDEAEEVGDSGMS